eukprot:CAMPEP_0198336216 /NCGR_PEP_ID=MMETSP1450-20131203/20855_1 /TAXON_ID=753684 ORGANISM="Madagascaria erythrocladiodes, Strain CCMP3234" /NCGR_SAMPLE_ID=MMETSP1450 /ASSEMBLY_ACC=CAM_ASM_001115 /LENGTH=619 /DNA_ID=CAMNT_0044040937 /DNA_START=439 /DNA_END=2298 /DNA_ORIENTATION=+
MHYFRSLPEQWRDRIRKLKAAGLNTLETYVAWNVHEPRRGQFRFEGAADLEKFIEIVAEEGLFMVVRPGPYICAEWELGGLPYWLLKDERMVLRSTYPGYLVAVQRYFDMLLPRLSPYLYHRGGPIVAIQVENEFGNYAYNPTYLRVLRVLLDRHGIDCLLLTADGAHLDSLQSGAVDGALKTVTMRKNPQSVFNLLQQVQPDAPLMTTELWVGWFDGWGKESHMVRPADELVKLITPMLSMGVSINFYMFHGGTNFGFMNGALLQNRHYYPHVTSYDYDALLTESGARSDKYFAVRDAIQSFYPSVADDSAAVSETPTFAPEAVVVEAAARLLDNVDVLMVGDVVRAERPLLFESNELDTDYGFVLYRTLLDFPRGRSQLRLTKVRDRAQVFLDGELVGTVTRTWQRGEADIYITVPSATVLDILVENLGRINYGSDLHDRKGLFSPALIGRHHVIHGYEMYSLPLRAVDVARLDGEHASADSRYGTFDVAEAAARNRAVLAKVAPAAPNTPAANTTVAPLPSPSFFSAHFHVSADDVGKDTYLDTRGWGKGVVYINDFCLGRYWSTRGPQLTLYVPAPLLHEGRNRVVLFEQEGVLDYTIRFATTPNYGKPAHTPDW